MIYFNVVKTEQLETATKTETQGLKTETETETQGLKPRPRPRLWKSSLETSRDRDSSLDNYISGNILTKFC